MVQANCSLLYERHYDPMITPHIHHIVPKLMLVPLTGRDHFNYVDYLHLDNTSESLTCIIGLISRSSDTIMLGGAPAIVTQFKISPNYHQSCNNRVFSLLSAQQSHNLCCCEKQTKVFRKLRSSLTGMFLFIYNHQIIYCDGKYQLLVMTMTADKC